MTYFHYSSEHRHNSLSLSKFSDFLISNWSAQLPHYRYHILSIMLESNKYSVCKVDFLKCMKEEKYIKKSGRGKF